ncbi:MAG: hypothetical protein AB7L90_22470 [Hyphomicrobiaceae bacterium]
MLTGTVMHMAEYLFVFGFYIFLPTAFARHVLLADWNLILRAYGLWFAILATVAVSHSGGIEEGTGWALILASFSTIPAIAVLIVLIRLKRRIVRLRAASRAAVAARGALA